MKIQSITRGKQHRAKAGAKKADPGKGYGKKGSEEYEAVLKAGKKAATAAAELTKTKSGIDRADLVSGGDATSEIDRQRAALKIQSIARGKQERKKTVEKKAEYDADPDKKPAGYKQYSEYHGDTSNPYMVKMNGGKKKKSSGHGDVYLAKEKAASKIQSIQRGKAARAKVDSVKLDYKANPDSAAKGYGKISDEEYEAKLKAGKPKN